MTVEPIIIFQRWKRKKEKRNPVLENGPDGGGHFHGIWQCVSSVTDCVASTVL